MNGASSEPGSALRIIFDDSVRISAEAAALIGVPRFGRLIHKRQQLAQRFVEAADAAGIAHVAHVRSQQELKAERDRVAQRTGTHRYLYFPANLVPSGLRESLPGFLGKLSYAIPNLKLEVGTEGDWSGVLLLDATTCREFLDSLLDASATEFIAAAGSFATIENTLGLLDLRDPAAFIDYLTSTFEVRHFNQIQSGDPYTIRKQSDDKAKLRREYQYYSMLPENLQMFFVQPFAFEEHENFASYRMERLLFPDMAMQWIHGSLSYPEFERFLAHVFHYVRQRPVKKSTSDAVRGRAEGLYIDKLEARLKQLEALDFYDSLDGLLTKTDPQLALDAQLERYKRIYRSIKRSWGHEIVMGHGDLCFSNILYGKSARVLKLIDPRGAADADDMYTDPYYDVAKLSHSVLGHYDYINSGLFTVSVGRSLRLELHLDKEERSSQEELFRAALHDHGFDERLTRLYEASLFLSMLPLHADVPSKVVAFALTASRILDELEDA